jgi:hypothetical protein
MIDGPEDGLGSRGESQLDFARGASRGDVLGKKAATAPRDASRTLIASMSGGSPTALLPYTTPGSRARVNRFTRKSGGHSPRLGGL